MDNFILERFASLGRENLHQLIVSLTEMTEVSALDSKKLFRIVSNLHCSGLRDLVMRLYHIEGELIKKGYFERVQEDGMG